jgi:hypothetical protein
MGPETGQNGAFAVDPDNPTIHSRTGYPMCIPRLDPAVGIDPLCPIYNRPLSSGGVIVTPQVGAPPIVTPLPPAGQPLTRFVMDDTDLPPMMPGVAPIAGATNIPACGLVAPFGSGIVNATNNLLNRPCDPRQQVPFMVGDNVVISATLAKDAKGTFLSAWNIEGQMGIFTKPCWRGDPVTGAAPAPGTPCAQGSEIVYTFQEVGLVATQSANADGVVVEGQDRIRVRGFLTDPSRKVDIYAMVSNPPGAVSPLPYDDGNLRFIGQVVPMRIPFGRYELFIQRDVCKNLAVFCPGGLTAGLPPIVDNHQGLDLGAPRIFYTVVSGTPAERTATQRPVRRNKPVPGVCDWTIHPNQCMLDGTPMPVADAARKCIQGTGPGNFKPDGVTPVPCAPTRANGLVAGQYWAPVGEYITAEAIQFGDAAIPNNFECMDFLVNGWTIATPTFSGSLGQLTPWPGGILEGSLPATKIACAPR